MPPDTSGLQQVSSPPSESIDLLIGLRAAQDAVTAVFRTMVDAVAHPGRVLQLPAAPEGVPPALMPVLAIADLRTTLFIDGNGSTASVAQALSRVTGSPLTDDVRAARIVTMLSASALTADVIWSLRVGSAQAPEDGATLFIACDHLRTATADEPDSIRTSGPGAAAGRWFVASGIDPSAIVELDKVNSGYPAGVDVYVVDAAGSMVALPRSNRQYIAGAR